MAPEQSETLATASPTPQEQASRFNLARSAVLSRPAVLRLGGYSQFPNAHNIGPESTVGPESPRLFSPPSLPETPPAQMLQRATSAPPVRRTRSMNSPPAASHPVLASAFAVAGTGAPDISQAPARDPTQRQLQLGPMFAFPLLLCPQEPVPFPSSASKAEPASLLEKVNSLPGPKAVLRSIIAERHNSLSLQDSSMLSDMLRRSQLHTDIEEPTAASSAGSANSQAGVSDDTAQPNRSGAEALPLKGPFMPTVLPANPVVMSTGSKAVLQNPTGVFQTFDQGSQVNASGPMFPPAHDPYLRAVSSCPKGHSKLPFPAGLLEGSRANDKVQSSAQAAHWEKSTATPNSLECRLVFPHGSRSHKRPRLEDRLKERNLMVAKHLVKARASDTPATISMFGPDR
ncbi:hypothetical protein WJX79_004945 [Trebouxia sp. C0005]